MMKAYNKIAKIEIAANRKTLERLEASRTNIVNVVVTPGGE